MVTISVLRYVTTVLMFVWIENQPPTSFRRIKERPAHREPTRSCGRWAEPGAGSFSVVRALFCLQPRKKSPLFWVPLNLWDIGVALILRGTKERNRAKRLTKDSDFKSPQAEQVGGVVRHQAPIHAFMFRGHGLDGECSRGGKWSRVIVEKPGVDGRWIRLRFHREGHGGAL